MGTIQVGQTLQVNKPVSNIFSGSISSGRKIAGITSYDEGLRAKMFADIEAQKEADRKKQEEEYNKYVEGINIQNAGIEAQNEIIRQQNEALKNLYDSTVAKIKTLNADEYTSYYYTIPDSIRSGFLSPEQINQSKIDEATRQQDELKRLANEAQTTANDFFQKEQQATSPERGDYYDQQKFLWEQKNQYYNQALQYATGDYELNDLIKWANDNAYGRIENFEAQKVAIANAQKEGYEPVYWNENPLSALIGFKPIEPVETVKMTAIPQTRLIPTMQKATIEQEQYVDQLGQPISYQKQYYLNPPKVDNVLKMSTSNLYTPFSKFDNPLVKAIKNQGGYKKQYTLEGMNIINLLSSRKRGTIGTQDFVFNVNVGKPIGFSEFLIGGVEGLTKYTTQGFEKALISSKQPLTQDIFYNLPYETKGTMITNPSTLKYELPTPQKGTYMSIEAFTAKVAGLAPELALWTYVPEVMAVPYTVRGTTTALNPSLTTMQRVSGGIEAGGALAFGFGGEITKLLPKSKVIIETTKLKVPARESVIGVNQINPVQIYEDIYGKQLTKYTYDIKSIIPEVSKSTGKINKVYKESVFGKLFGKEPKLVYSGNPYLDKVGYGKAIEQLKLTGTTEKQAKSIIRFTAPKYAESTVKGEAYALFGEDLSKPITKIKIEQKVTPKIIKINGVKTRNFQPIDYLITSKGVEVGSKGDIIFYKSMPESTERYLTKEGALFSKLKQAGKTTEVFKQITGIKSLGAREYKMPISDIGYARTYVPKELEAFKDISVSRKIIPNERKLIYGKSNILTSNIEEPIIVTYEPSFRVTKEIKTGSVTGTSIKREGLTEQQKLVQIFDTSYKPLNLVKEAKQNLIKEEQRVASESIKQQFPINTFELKQVKIKEVPIKEVKNIKLPVSTLGAGLGINPFKSLTGQGKMENLSGGGKFGSLGVAETRFKTLEPQQKTITITKTDDKFKLADFNKFKTDTGFKYKSSESEQNKLNNLFKLKANELLKTKQQQKQQQKQQEVFKYKQPEVFNPVTKTDIFPRTPESKIPRIPKNILFKESNLTKKQADILSKAFSVLIRSKGKVSEIGKGLPYGKALKLGVEKTKSSLAQTFALRESGTTRGNDIPYRVPENLFTQPKRARTKITGLTWVERRGKTLTHYPEISGIQEARRNKLKWL